MMLVCDPLAPPGLAGRVEVGVREGERDLRQLGQEPQQDR